MVNEITTWAHTVTQNAQNSFYVNYQINGDSQIKTGPVIGFIDAGTNYYGVKEDNNYYALHNYSSELNDYYYCFSAATITQVAGMVNGNPALKLGGNELGFLQNLANTLAFNAPNSIVQPTLPIALFSLIDQSVTLNNVTVPMNPSPIWVQFYTGEYNVSLKNHTNFGPIISSLKLMNPTGTTDSSLLQLNQPEIQPFFSNLKANISTNCTPLDTQNTILPILGMTDTISPNLSEINNVFFLSVRGLTVLKPYSVFWVNQLPYYLVKAQNGGFLNASNERVAVLKSIPVVGDGELTRTGQAPQVYVPCRGSEIPPYVGLNPIKINIDQISNWQGLLHATPMMQNLDPPRQAILSQVLTWGFGALRKLTGK